MDTCVFVLGMHRSGTSAITGLLSMFGGRLGDDLLPPNPANPKGYFESRRVVEINNTILKAAGSSWDDMRPLPSDWRQIPSVIELMPEINSILSTPGSPRGFQLIKDPRLSKTLPLWLEILQQQNRKSAFVICLREPASVAESERNMKGFPLLKSLVLYMEYLLQAELNTREYTRCFISHDELLNDWAGTIRNIDKLIGLGLPGTSKIIANSANNFIEKDLNRSVYNDATAYQAVGSLGDMASNLFQELKKCDKFVIDSLKNRFENYRRDLIPWMDVLQNEGWLENRNPLAKLPTRFFKFRFASRVSWSKSLSGEIDAGDFVQQTWAHSDGRLKVKLPLKGISETISKLRIGVINCPALIVFHSLAIYKGGELTYQCNDFNEVIVGHSKCAVKVSVQIKEQSMQWLFTDGKGFLDFQLPNSDMPFFDQLCELHFEFEAQDISKGYNKLLDKLCNQDSKKFDIIRAEHLNAEIDELTAWILKSKNTTRNPFNSKEKELDEINQRLIKLETKLTSTKPKKKLYKAKKVGSLKVG